MSKLPQKYRGRDFDKEWYYGYFVPNAIYNDYGVFEHVEVETVGKFTGFYDCEGTEVYEDDVITCGIMVGNEWEEHKAIVQWDLAYGMFILYMPDINDEQMMDIAESCKIIGNIHDDPDLLEEE